MPKKFASMTDSEVENAFSTSILMRHIYDLFVEAQDGATHSRKRAAIRSLMEKVFTIEEHRLMLAQQVDAEKKRYIDLLARLDRTEAELINIRPDLGIRIGIWAWLKQLFAKGK